MSLKTRIRELRARDRLSQEDLARKVLTEDEVEILITLSQGDAQCTCWGCDITYDYIKINGDYRT